MVEIDTEALLREQSAVTRRVHRIVGSMTVLFAVLGISLLMLSVSSANRARGAVLLAFALAGLVILSRMWEGSKKLSHTLLVTPPIRVRVVIQLKEEVRGEPDTYVQIIEAEDAGFTWDADPVSVTPPDWRSKPIVDQVIPGLAYIDPPSGQWLAIATEFGLLVR